MKSKILVDYDFDAKETFLQIKLEGYDVDGGDLPDKHLKSFVEEAIRVGSMIIMFNGAGNGLPQIRIGCNAVKPEINQDEFKKSLELLSESLDSFSLHNVNSNLVDRIKFFLNSRISE